MIYILLFMGEYFDQFDTYEQAKIVKDDYNSFFSDNSEIITSENNN